MGNEQNGDAGFALDIHQQLEHLFLHQHIQRRHGFICNQYIRLHHNGAGQTKPLSLTTRKLMRIALQHIRVQAHNGQDLGHAFDSDFGINANVVHALCQKGNCRDNSVMVRLYLNRKLSTSCLAINH